MNIVVSPADVTEFGLFEDAGAIVFGVKFRHGDAVRTLMIQVPDPKSALQEGNTLGMYIEMDDRAFYGGVYDYKYNATQGLIRLTLDPQKSGGIDVLELELPSPRSATDESLLEKLAWAYESSLPSRH